MVKKARFTPPKLWLRRNGRLCRHDSIEDSDNLAEDSSKSQIISSNCCKRPQSCILHLPEECLVIVFKSLTAYELSKVSRVCKRFYHVCCNPTLWNSVDLLFEDFSSVLFGHKVPNTKMRMSFASFLSARKAALTKIRATGGHNMFFEADMFIYLLNNCNVKNLKKIEFWLDDGWDLELYGLYQPLQRVLRCFVQNCRNSLKFLRCYLDVSYTTAKLIGSLHSLEYLNVFFPSQEVLQPEALDVILSSLPNLKHFKITLIRQPIWTVSEDYFPGYVLKSDSLETLDLGLTKAFSITKMILPKLHTINAAHLSIGSPMARELCLFDITERGCPLIQSINGYTSPLPGLQNFQLSNIQKRELSFCKCVVHSLHRGLQ